MVARRLILGSRSVASDAIPLHSDGVRIGLLGGLVQSAARRASRRQPVCLEAAGSRPGLVAVSPANPLKDARALRDLSERAAAARRWQ